MFGGLADNFQIADNGIENQLITLEGFQCQAVGLAKHFIGGFQNILQEKGPIMRHESNPFR